MPPSLLAQWDTPQWLDDSEALHLPPRNEFIPTDFTLRSEKDAHPTVDVTPSTRQVTALGPNGAAAGNGATGALTARQDSPGQSTQHAETVKEGTRNSPSHPTVIHDDAHLRVWFKQDDVFFTPRLNAFFVISSPVAMESAKSAALTELIAKLLEDALIETTYMVRLRSSVESEIEGVDG